VVFKLLFYNARIFFNHWNTVKFLIDQIFLIGIAVLSGGALLWPALTQRGKKASPQEVTLLINRAKAAIVDVRDAAAFTAGHLPDAKNIPDKFKNRTIVVVCQQGSRAFGAAKILEKAGYENVVVLEGGQAAWETAGLPLAK
jgi:rhodanese-related sulfurtransferase